MSLPTCQVRVVVFDSAGGAPVAGAQVQAQLSSYDVGDGYVVPRLVVGTTDIDGEAFLDLWPNQLGSSESFYTVTITAPNGKRLRTIAVVPNQASADLQDIAELPPYEGKPDAAVYLNTVIQAAVDVTQKAQQVHDDALTATGAAGVATQEASDAGQSALNAATSATSAAGHEAGALAAKTATELSAGAALAAGRIKATVAEARAAYPATTLPDSISWVLPNATDGFTALTAIRNAGSGAGQWVKVMALANDDDVAKLLNAAAPSPLTAIGGTANAITGTSGTIRQPLPGCSVRFTPLYANTGATTLTLTLAGGGASAAYGFIDDNGGPLGAGTLQPGYNYEALFTGSNWRIIRYGDDHERVKRTAQKLAGLSVTTGTTSDYAGSTAFPLTLADGVEVTLIPPSDNAAPPRLSVAGTSGPFFNIRYQNGGPVPVGGLRADRYYRLAWQSTGSIWKIVVNGYDTERIDGLLKTAPSMLTSVGGTPNAITAISSTITQVVVNTRVLFFPIADNTGAANLAVGFPDGTFSAAYNLVDAAGGAIAPKTLRPGRPYEAVFNGAVWRIFGYGDDHERIRRGTVQPLVIDTGASTANAIVATTEYPADLAEGTPFYLVPIADNTGSVNITLNGAGPFNLRRNNGGALTAGALKAGYKYLLNWQSAGSVITVTLDGAMLPRLLDMSTMKVLSVGGTGDAITVATEMGDATNQGSLLKFVPTAANTGAATINVNGTGAFAIRKNGNQPLEAGDLKPLAAALFYFTGTQFLLIANGQIPTPTSDQLDANVSAMQAAISTTPYGSQTYTNGVMTLAPNIWRIPGIGDSLSQGAGSLYPDAANPDADKQYAPARRFAEILGEELARVGAFSLPYELLGVPGSFDGSGGNGLVAQFAGRAFLNPTFVPIVGGTNSATTFGVFNQAGLAGQIAANESAWKNIIAAGGIPLPCSVMHPHPLWYWQQAGGATGDNVSKMVWPTFTFDVSIPFVVDAGAQTITGAGITSNAGIWGTDKIGPGSAVQFADGTNPAGPNAGTHIVGSRSGDTLYITGGTLLASESATRRLVHVMSAAENMTLLPLPPSQRYQRIDRTGNGATMGLKLYDLYNAELGALAKRLRVPFLEIDKLAFDFVLANGGCALTWDPATRTMSGTSAGWDAGHTTTKAGSPDVKQFNHPNLALRQATFDVAFRKLARLIASGKFTRDVVIRS